MKLAFISAILICLAIGCRTSKNSVVGVWKPKEIILPANLVNDSLNNIFIKGAFEQSKDVSYKFNPDGTFTFLADNGIPELQNVKGTYSIKGSILTLNYNDNIQESKIIKLTDKEMRGQSKDSIIIVYEKIIVMQK
jgi:hypothetical protein